MPTPDNDMFAEFAESERAYQTPLTQEPQAPVPLASPGSQQGAPPASVSGDQDLSALLDMVAGRAPAAVPEPVAPVATPSQMIPYERFEQVNTEVAYLRGVVETMMRGQAPGGAPLSDPNGLPPGVDPEIYGYVEPIVKMHEAQIDQRYAPLVEYAQRQLATEKLSKLVPGFEADMMPALEQAYLAVPEATRNEYNGLIGAEVLARRLVAERSAGGAPSSSMNTPAAGAARAHSLGRGDGFQGAPHREFDVFALSEPEFAALKRASEERYGRRSENEPDSILDGRI
jgi:hypothetical protein